MKRTRLYILLLCAGSFSLNAQNWLTLGGNNLRNSSSRMPGPDTLAAPVWTVTSTKYTAWGNTVLVNGDRLVTTRTQITPAYVGQVECRNLSDGALKWTASIPGGKLYAVGFDDYAVYVHNYTDNLFYALDPANGNIRWQHPEPVLMFGGTAGILYACNGDPVVIGKRIDRYTGATVWETNYTIPVSPDAGYAAYGETYYHWEGSILTPKRLIALDMETGELKYKSDPLPGDGDQEWPLTVGSDGTVYIARDGGLLYAFADDGSGFQQKWSSAAAPESRIAEGPDGSLYYYRAGRILRVRPDDGAVLDTSITAISTDFQPLITVDPDGRVFVNNDRYSSPGRYYCFSADLQTQLWQLSIPTNYYAAVAPGMDGTVVVCGEGYQMKAYRFTKLHRPVADFKAGKIKVLAGEPVDFRDLSSFAPTSWEWHFPGSNMPVAYDQHPSGVVYDAEGIYEVSLTVGNGLGADTLVRMCYLQVDGFVDAEEISGPASGLKIYPQPAGEVFYLETPPGTRVEIWTIDRGTAVFEGTAQSAVETVHVGNWPPGVYLTDFHLPDGGCVRKKVLIAR